MERADSVKQVLYNVTLNCGNWRSLSPCRDEREGGYT